MRTWLSVLLGLALLPFATMNTAQAQDGPVYAVSYIDAAPASRAAVVKALQQLAAASRKDDGNQRLEILQRLAPPNQFVMVSIWRDKKSYDAHAAAAHTKDFREKMRPQLISLVDDRLHSAFEIASGPAGKVPAGAIFVVTHVDVPPPKKDECEAALKALAADSRKEVGVERFEVFQQSSRPNHFTVVEVWKNQKAYDAHITSAHTKKFRDTLTPMSGALYDERLYKAL
jgi:quinol monooxygenase YgiN